MTSDNLQASVKRICALADRIAARTPAAYLAAMVRYMEPEPDEPPHPGGRGP